MEVSNILGICTSIHHTSLFYVKFYVHMDSRCYHRSNFEYQLVFVQLTGKRNNLAILRGMVIYKINIQVAVYCIVYKTVRFDVDSIKTVEQQTFYPSLQGDAMGIEHYSKICKLRRTKSQNLNDSRLVLQLPLSNPLKSGV